MKKIIKKTILSVMTCLALLLGCFPTASGLQVYGAEKQIPVYGSYSSGTNIQWADLNTVVLGEDTGQTANVSISVDPTIRYQEYQGLGISLDETGISNLWKLSKKAREDTIKKLVDPVEGAGNELFRITIGSPDTIEHLPFWSYSELPEGVKDDFDLKYFSIQKDIDYHIIEVIKLIQSYNPNAQFFASAWSAPAWMTTSNTFTGYVLPNPSGGGFYQASKLRDDCINVFARYYAKFIQAYAEQGIDIFAITLLNEPGMDVVYPAMDISIEQQQKLSLEIKKEFALAGIETELWAHDFNFWDWKDPGSTQTKNYYRIYEDSTDGTIKGKDVLNATDGIAFHPYWGDAGVMQDAALEFKGKGIHLTETGSFASQTIIDYFNKYMNSYTGWTAITDQTGGTLHWTDARNNNLDWSKVNPKWPNRLIVTNHDTGVVSYTSSFYSWGQFAKYLDQGLGSREGAVRVSSSGTQSNVSNVTFQNPDGEMVMVVRNGNTGGSGARTVKVSFMGKAFVQTLPAGSTATLRWYPENASNGSSVVNGPAKTQAGETFILKYGLEGVSRNVLAHDVTVAYDADAVQFIGFVEPPLNANYKVLESVNNNGKLRFIAVNLQDEDKNGVLVELKFKAIPTLQPKTAKFDVQTTLATDTEEYSLREANYAISIQAVDHGALSALIGEAQAFHDTATEGSRVSQYPVGSKQTLQTAINKAKAVDVKTDATAAELLNAFEQLNGALQAFKSLVKQPEAGSMSIGDLATVAKAYGKKQSDADWNLYSRLDYVKDGVIDIKDLVYIAKLILKN